MDNQTLGIFDYKQTTAPIIIPSLKNIDSYDGAHQYVQVPRSK